MSIPLELFGSVGAPNISIDCPLPESVFYVTLEGDFMAVDVKSEKCASTVTRTNIAVQLQGRTIARSPGPKSIQMKTVSFADRIGERHPSYIRMAPPHPLSVFIHWPTGELACRAEILSIPQSQKYSMMAFGRLPPYAFLSDFRLWHISPVRIISRLFRC